VTSDEPPLREPNDSVADATDELRPSPTDDFDAANPADDASLSPSADGLLARADDDAATDDESQSEEVDLERALDDFYAD
jgi:hypothetical protein